MKTTFALCSLLLSVLASAQITETYNFNGLNLAIPDGNPSGVADARTIVSAIDTITEVRVTMSILPTPDLNPAAFNGDLYVFLQHGSAITILINRPGRALGDDFGYGDEGIIITFDDSAPNGDFHVYRNITTPPAGSPVTGTWQPDGRNIDPNLVLSSTPRSALLGSFNGLNANGQWTLFAADLSTGAKHTLNSYSIEVKGVPEPGTAALLGAGILAGMLHRRRSY